MNVDIRTVLDVCNFFTNPLWSVTVYREEVMYPK